MMNKIWEKLKIELLWIKRKIVWFFVGGVVMAATISTIPPVEEDVVISEIEKAQNTFFQKNGKYFQGERTTTIIPKDGRSVAIEKNWGLDLPTTLKYQYEIREYVSPLGPGYQIMYRKEVNGIKYEKSIGYGPESMTRTYDWQQILSHKEAIGQ